MNQESKKVPTELFSALRLNDKVRAIELINTLPTEEIFVPEVHHHHTTVLHLAITKKFEDIALLLLAKRDQYLKEHPVSMKDAPLSLQDGAGKTPLHNAITNECRKVIDAIIARGTAIQLYTPDIQGKTPLQIAIAEGDLLTAKQLIAIGTSELFLKPDNYGENAVDTAVTSNHFGLARDMYSMFSPEHVKAFKDKYPTLHQRFERESKLTEIAV